MDIMSYKGCVYPWHCDHMGHMNVMWYVGKFDEATWNFFAELTLTPAYFRENDRGMAAVQQNITYRREAMPGDLIEVRTRLAEHSGKSIRFVHEMRLPGTPDVLATCELTGVHLDRTRRKGVEFPDAIRTRMSDMLPAGT
jgi:acyl-CoA thioester hydrolase